ncbi:GspH/FimT family pseudopilin [Ectopseudomonas guguanensis]|uniref:Type II secretion system protein H n=1 Tax=Ectopseudomonas guguanensis TaxID=1198456 RepID=A0A1H0MI03_9GAMM|nr:GspH/FimT family pseudopilin [Pseudomonas guguanensis]MDR8014846.1 GspH/FimT family pseudopilin [Pseudomonas guguanensis]SDO79991.1 type IV fimbrial biogenesis protein FimT [Pseudomonas guguanensis]
MHYSRAFTLIELMVTLAVLAVVISLAAPSFSNMLQENRLAAMSSELQGALQLARSEAVRRRANVTLCRSNTTQTACSNGTDWATGGWMMIAGTEVLKVWDPIQGAVVTGPNSGIVFRSNGMASAQSWTVTHSSCTGQQKRTISVNATGSTTLAKGDC